MGDRFLKRSAVMLFLIRVENGVQEILLQKRLNTSYADGMWDCAASGHVDENESMKMALIREAKEEIEICIEMQDVEFATITHKYTPVTKSIYYNAFFVVRKYSGVPSIKEPNKCSDLKWFPIKNLPDEFLEDRRQALQNYFSKVAYDESGWDYTK